MKHQETEGSSQCHRYTDERRIVIAQAHCHGDSAQEGTQGIAQVEGCLDAATTQHFTTLAVLHNEKLLRRTYTEKAGTTDKHHRCRYPTDMRPKQTYFPYVILRPTGVYGPGEKDYFMEIQSVKSGLDFAVGAIPQRITFIYVKDLATVAFLSLEKEEIKNRHYFVADGDVYTDESFARMIQDILGKKRVLHARIPLGLVRIACHCSEWIGKLLKKSMTLNSDKYIILKQRNWICDVTPLQDDLGFIPAYPLRKGLEESIEWYKKEGWL